MAPPRAGEQISGDSAELADCIAVIRSLVLIRKQLTTLRDINDEYKAMEGEVIPYTRFGFSSLEEMLRRSEEFNISRQLSGAVSTCHKMFPWDSVHQYPLLLTDYNLCTTLQER